jgi:hypothetical protein
MKILSSTKPDLDIVKYLAVIVQGYSAVQSVNRRRGVRRRASGEGSRRRWWLLQPMRYAGSMNMRKFISNSKKLIPMKCIYRE